MRRWTALPVAVFARLLVTCALALLVSASSAPAWAATPKPHKATTKRGQAGQKSARLPRVNLTPDVALHDTSGAALGRWGAAYKQALRKKGTARALFWGASHTAADFWTGHLRRLWQSRSDESGHGFVFPVRFHLGYRHTDLNLTSSPGWQILRYQADAVPPQQLPLEVGLQGVVATSSDPNDFCELRTTTDNPNGRTWQLVEVWAQGRPDGGSLRIEHEGPDGAEVSVLSTRGSGLRTVTLRAADAPHRLRLSPVGDGPVSLLGVVLERDRPGVIVDQMGIPGMRAGVWLKWAEQSFLEQIRRRKPDLVVLAYGTNDVGDADEPIATYVATWRQVLARLRKAAPDVSCILVGPTDRLKAEPDGTRRTLARTPQVIEAQRQVAQEFGCAHFDAVAAMGGGMAAWQKAKLAQSDDVHLTKLGYEAMAVQLDNAIIRHVAAADQRALLAKKAAAKAAKEAAARAAKAKKTEALRNAKAKRVPIRPSKAVPNKPAQPAPVPKRR